LTYSYPEIKAFRGLFAQPNTFSLPDGAMEQASNVVINDDNILQKIRGFYSYYPSGASTLNSLFTYQSRLIGVFNDKIVYFSDFGSEPNTTGTATTLSGHPVGVTSPLVSRSIEQNGNLYFTSDTGVLKLDAYNGTVFQAGTAGGLDCRGSFLPLNGPIPGDSQIAYRVCFGREDTNGNLILGAPSDIVPLTNAIQTRQSTGALIAWTRVSSIVTVTSAGHNLVNGMQITVVTSGGNHPVAAGSYTVSNVTITTFDITSAGNSDTSTLTWKASRTALIEASIPDDINLVSQNYFIQIYRTTESNSETASPSADFKLVEQITLDSVSLSNRVFSYQDTTDSVLLTNATELYTNPNSREGELQANLRPPYCTDIALFQNYVFYANCIARHVLNIDVIDTGAIADNDYVEIKVDAVTRRYVARSGVGNQSVQSESISNAAGNLSINYTAHGFLAGDTVFVSFVSGGSLTVGTYIVNSTGLGANAFQLLSGVTPVAYSAVTYLYFQGVTNGTYPIFQYDKTSASVGTQLRRTAQGLIKAINRDLPSLVYGNYVSAIDDTPGKIRISAEDFTGTIYLRGSSTGICNAFSQVLPTSFSTGNQVFSRNNIQKNAVFISKVSEPEAVPVVNYLLVGSKNKAIKRIFALRDSVILLKEDGIFKITGNNIANFSVTPLDTTVIVLAENSGALLNNKVYFIGTQGICSATDSSVEILSRRIENFIEPILGQANLNDQTAAVSYESDRTYRISTLGYNSTSKSITYIYNSLNDTWTSSDYLFTAGVVGPSNKLFLVSNNQVLKERKYGNRLEFTGQNYSCLIVSITPNMRQAVIQLVGRTPEVGDVLVYQDVVNRIRSVVPTGTGQFTVTFAKTSNLTALLTVQLYANIKSAVVMAPFHGGVMGLGKQFAQIQLHTRTNNISRIKLTFQGQSFGGSEEAEWLETRVTGTTAGWGFAPWGFFPWGQADLLDAKVITEPAPVVRIYVPLFQQRNTFIQAIMNHQEAAESMDIQTISWAMRAYRERVSK
jgi:hypothetical protein